MTNFRYGKVVAGVTEGIEQEEIQKMHSQVVGGIIQIGWYGCMEGCQELN